MTYVDPVLGRRDYTGVSVGRYDLFLVEVSNTEMARMAAAPLQGKSGRKYGGRDDDGPWYVSYNPSIRWPGSRVRPYLRPKADPRATVVPLDADAVDEIESLLDGDGTEDPSVPADATPPEPVAPPDADMEGLNVAITRCRVCRSEYPENLTEDWMPPRGWAGALVRRGPLPFILVSLNPGAPLEGERENWQRVGLSEGTLSTPDQARELLRVSSEFYDHGETPFHKASVAIARACAYLVDPALARRDWREFAWMTDLYKCSTNTEVGPRISAAALRRCAFSVSEGFLRREIALLAPKVIVALGEHARAQLLRHPVSRERIAAFRHPSGAFWRLDDEHHDEPFNRVGELLGVRIPDGFREVRGAFWREAFA